MAKVEYQELRLRNAYLYDDCTVPLNRQGLVLIRGLNLDDGGYLACGKSTLFDAFSRIQFGKGGKQDTVADIVNPNVGRDLEISLSLSVDGKPYEIRQYRNHHRYGTAFQVVDLSTGSNVLPADSRTHPQVWIRDHLLHSDETSFFNTAYLTQSHTHVLLHGKEAERRQRLTAMFGLDIYDQIYDQLHSMEKLHENDLRHLDQISSRLSDLKQQLRGLPSKDELSALLQRAETRLAASQESLDQTAKELETRQEVFSALKLRQNLEEDLAAAWRKATSLQRVVRSPQEITRKQAKRVQRNYEHRTKERARLEAHLAGAKERGIIDKQLEGLAADLTKAGNLDGVDAELTRIKTRLAHLNGVELPQAEKLHELGQQLTKLEAVSGDTSKLSATCDDLTAKVKTLEQQIQKDLRRLESGVCSECKRPLDMTDIEVAQLKQGVKTSREELKRTKESLFAKQGVLKSLQRREEITTEMEAITTTRTVEEVDREIADLVKTERRLSRLTELAKQKEVLEARLEATPKLAPGETPAALAALTEEVAALRTQARAMARIAELNRKLRKLPSGDVAAEEKAVQRCRSKLRSLTAKIGRRSQRVANLSSKADTVGTLTEEYKALRKKVKESESLRERLACLSVLRTAFGPKGIKQRRFHAILSEATESTIPVYSQLLWPTKQISLELEDSEGIKFYLRREGQKQLVSSNVLSGGERHKAGLAFLLGLRDLKEAYTGSSFNLLVVDEPFGNLDPQGEQAFLSVLEMLKDRFGSIFIISHRPEVLGSSAWDQTWWVVRRHNRSKLYRDGDLPTKYLKLAETYMTTDGD